MKCPQCGHNEDRVLDTREQREGEVIRRRRECLKCKSRFATVETLSVSYPLVIKKDGRREPFARSKILHGLQAACQKRPISLSQLDSIVDKISNWIVQGGDKEIPARTIGQKVMQELRLLDDVAYIRFASVYRTFKDVQEFVETLEHQESTELFESAAQIPLALERVIIIEKNSDRNLEKSTHETTSARDRSTDPIPN